VNLGADDVRAAYPLFPGEGGGSTPTSALGLFFCKTDLETVIRLNWKWHSRLPHISRSNMQRTRRLACYAAEADGIFYAAAVWTQPVARLLNPDWLELRRLAIADDAPKNTASRFLGWMVRDIKARWPGVPRLISYQDTAVHRGTIYRASGWTDAGVTNQDGAWDRPNRHRRAAQSGSPKRRWELRIGGAPC
jgi:hypothetical protein